MVNLAVIEEEFGNKSAIPEHYLFYLRGVLNSMVTHYLPNKLPSTVTEDDVSGEYLEALRLVVERSAPDLKVGEATGLTYDDVMQVLGGQSIFKKEGGPTVESIGEIIRTTLGNFGVKKTKDGYEVFDTYDYEPVHEGGFKDHVKEAFSDYQNESFYAAARTMGGYFTPENADGYSKENALRVNIKIPQEPKVVNIDYDDDIPEGAEEFVFRGPMTNKRKSIWDMFTSMFITPAEAAQKFDENERKNIKQILEEDYLTDIMSPTVQARAMRDIARKRGFGVGTYAGETDSPDDL